MDRDLLSHLPVVLAVARRGGFAAAAAELGMSPSAVSHAVKTVEERLAVCAHDAKRGVDAGRRKPCFLNRSGAGRSP